MIKIAYDHQAFASQHVGGITRYFYELAKRIDRTDKFRADIVAPVHFNSYLRAGEVRVYGKYIPPIPRTGNVIRALNTALSPMLFRMLRPSILHETYYSSKRLAPAGTPVVITVYDMVHEVIPIAFRAEDPTSRNKRSAVERADHVICVSENTRKDLVELFGVPISKTSVIHLGSTFTLSETEDIDALRELKRPFLLYVGHRGHWKNFHGLLKAYGSSPVLRRDFALVTFGGGPLSRAEENGIRAVGLAEGSVRQISGSDAVLASLYRKASLFVYPSLYEGFGIPPLEAMGFDCPVACSNTSSIPEVVGDAAILFDPADIDSMRSAIEEVVGSDDKKADLIRRGRERIKLFSWRRCATETSAIYRRIAN